MKNYWYEKYGKAYRAKRKENGLCPNCGGAVDEMVLNGERVNCKKCRERAHEWYTEQRKRSAVR